MRKQRLITGFNNSQKIRVIVNGVGFYTTVGETENICTRKHRTATQIALLNLSNKRNSDPQSSGFSFNYVYTDDGSATSELVPVQVDLI